MNSCELLESHEEAAAKRHKFPEASRAGLVASCGFLLFFRPL